MIRSILCMFFISLYVYTEELTPMIVCFFGAG